MMPSPPELVVVMPAYNEQDTICAVVEEWDKVLAASGMDYRIRIYDDGSKDDTGELLDSLSAARSRVEIYHKANSGHGPTILKGYREALDSEWLFQVDSDDEIGPVGFEQLWSERNQYDLLIGRRSGRNSPSARRVVSFLSRMIVALLYGQGISDVNSPYRLMRTVKFGKLFHNMPDTTFAPNVIICGFACATKLRFTEIPMPCRPSHGGPISLRRWRLFRAVLRSFGQTVRFRICNMRD